MEPTVSRQPRNWLPTSVVLQVLHDRLPDHQAFPVHQDLLASPAQVVLQVLQYLQAVLLPVSPVQDQAVHRDQARLAKLQPVKCVTGMAASTPFAPTQIVAGDGKTRRAALEPLPVRRNQRLMELWVVRQVHPAQFQAHHDQALFPVLSPAAVKTMDQLAIAATSTKQQPKVLSSQLWRVIASDTTKVQAHYK